jgi:hypothetical protein
LHMQLRALKYGLVDESIPARNRRNGAKLD